MNPLKTRDYPPNYYQYLASDKNYIYEIFSLCIDINIDCIYIQCYIILIEYFLWINSWIMLEDFPKSQVFNLWLAIQKLIIAWNINLLELGIPISQKNDEKTFLEIFSLFPWDTVEGWIIEFLWNIIDYWEQLMHLFMKR